ncbi:Transcription factor [Microbotryomycetes sp. JL201]|nr:Transcription factor [Microbotryomycetes sp. JL201]
MDVDSSRRDDQQGLGRHVRASSDPGSRGGAFGPDGFGLDSEPNPFENSFSGGPSARQAQAPSAHHPHAQNPHQVPGQGPPSATRRARSISPNSLARATPGGRPQGLAFGTDLQNYNWGAADFDPSLLRTGLTPMVPGQAGQSGGVPFPPPSPATAALFAMMTNNTPGDHTAAFGVNGQRPSEGNQFDASFARAAVKQEPPASAYGLAPPASSVATAPMAQPLPHVSSVSNDSSRPASAVMGPPVSGTGPYFAPPHQHMYAQSAPYGQYGTGVSQPPAAAAHPPIASQPSYGGSNPLYLLSQASGHADDAVVAAAALSGLAAPGFGSPQPGQPSLPGSGAMPANVMSGPSTVGPQGASTLSANSPASASTPNSTKGASAAPKRSGAANGAGKRKKAEPVHVDEDLDSPPPPPAKKGRGRGRATSSSVKDELSEDGASPRGKGPLDPEEEKRRNFLERNRQAALKCRQRKKAWLANLQSKVEMLTTDNETLQSTVTNLKEEIQSLRAILAAHANCPVGGSAMPRAPQYANGQRY